MGTPAQERKKEYDVVICGAGLAGLCLGRQLKRQMPHLSVLMIDKMKGPLPEAAHKVGESSVALGAYYFEKVLDLGQYLYSHHQRKLGLRYYFGDSTKPPDQRPEMGKNMYSNILNEWQLDRGMLENDLRRFNQEAGVHFAEGAQVEKIEMGGREAGHVVRFSDESGEHEVKGRWLVDALGRRGVIRRKLDLGPLKIFTKRSSAWWRVKGKVDVSTMVPRTNTGWHDIVPNDQRFSATTHFMGPGYWVWFIPLGSGTTSIGIVADESVKPSEEYNTYDRARAWLRKYEPRVADYLAAQFEKEPPLDYIFMKDYSYFQKQVFSFDRWACVGEAGVFPDPFYSPGSDSIAFGNSTLCELVRLDDAGELDQETVQEWEKTYLAWAKGKTESIQSSYPYHGNGLVMRSKILWDFCMTCASNFPLYHGALFKKEGLHGKQPRAEVIRRSMDRFHLLDKQVVTFLREWGDRSTGEKANKGYVNYIDFKPLEELAHRGAGHDSKGLDDMPVNLERLEEVAQSMFFLALHDLMPEKLEMFSKLWINPYAITLDPSRWEQDGLFKPMAPEKDIRPIVDHLTMNLMESPLKKAG